MMTNLNPNPTAVGAERFALSGGFARPAEDEPLTVQTLTSGDEAEVLDFLSERAAHTFTLVGFVRSNGLVSRHNRGAFYAYRNAWGELQGVALIGRFILFEARNEAAIRAFALAAQQCRAAYLLLGEREAVRRFWGYYSQGGHLARLSCRELLMEQRWPVEVYEEVPALRLATADDLELIIPPHAQLTHEESGIDPLKADPEGFRQRCAHRIEQGKTWVWVKEGKLLFKVDVITDTAEVVYLEGVWVDPQERGKGYGLRCMTQLGRAFLSRTRCVCLLVNERFKPVQALYRRAGYKVTGHYDTIYLRQEQ